MTLTSRILALMMGIVLAVVAIAAIAAIYLVSEQIDREFRERSLTVAASVAALPEVRQAVSLDDPDGAIQPLAESVRIASGADFVVVTDENGVRFSHPNPGRIGERVSTDPGPALAGATSSERPSDSNRAKLPASSSREKPSSTGSAREPLPWTPMAPSPSPMTRRVDC